MGDELRDEERGRIEAEAVAQVGAERLVLIHRLMSVLEGPDWATGVEKELEQVVDGPGAGKLFWKIGERQFDVEEYVVETTISSGRPTRRRVIGREGVVREDAIFDPGLN
jgi:hypothetical protein